jgi:putative ABC transport system substrate-binding protein
LFLLAVTDRVMSDAKQRNLPLGFARDRVRAAGDVIITHALLGARTAAHATKTIPIVMADDSDPVAAGLVATYARPGGNITGSTSLPLEMYAKRLELLKEVLPRLTRVALLVNAQNPSFAVVFRETETAAERMKLELHQFAVKQPEELPGAFTANGRKGSVCAPRQTGASWSGMG